MMETGDDEVNVGNRIERVNANYTPTYQRFILSSKNFVQQYNQVYLHRLEQMREHLRFE
jgi:hypothetical protein